MFAQIRLILIFISALIFAYGGWMFWTGKTVVEHARNSAKPRAITLDELAVNPPQKSGEWYKITDGGASLSRGLLQDLGDESSTVKNAPFFLFVPILSKRDAAKTETVGRISDERPLALVVLRSKNKEYRQTYRTLTKIQSAPSRTTNEWLLQNKKRLIIQPPFTGVLRRLHVNTTQNRGFTEMHVDLQGGGWMLLEGEKPTIPDNPQVAIGLVLMMGLPTIWLFGLLFAGKLDPPDDEPLAGASPTKVAQETVAAPGSFVMPSAMPVAEEPPTKTPRP